MPTYHRYGLLDKLTAYGMGGFRFTHAVVSGCQFLLRVWFITKISRSEEHIFGAEPPHADRQEVNIEFEEWERGRAVAAVAAAS